MGILVECPKCKVRGSVKRKVCKCGNQVQKSDSKNYWIDYYINGKRTRERTNVSSVSVSGSREDTASFGHLVIN